MKKKKMLSLFLSILVLLGCFPVTATSSEAFAESNSESNAISEIGDLNVYNEYSTRTQSFIIGEKIGSVEEVVSLREENVKHFRLSNGSYEAVSFATAVHRKDTDGVWQDINNNLTLRRNGEEQGYFTDDMRTRFADVFVYGRELFSVRENNYIISMIPISAGKVVSENKEGYSLPIVTNAKRTAQGTVFDSIESAIQIDNKVSILYNDIRENTNIEYILNGNNIKENIIVKSKADSYEYAFQLKLTGLTAELNREGCILIRDAKTKQVKYTIPAPFMFDESGEYSNDVCYELKAVSEGNYTLKIVANEEWINSNDRSFPVTIDPTIQGNIWIDTYIDSQNPNASYSYSDSLIAGHTKTALIKPYIPNIPLNISSIDSAELYISYYDATDSFIVGLYEVSGMITETTTYNNAPSISTSRTSAAIMWSSTDITEDSPSTVMFDISLPFRNWYYGAAYAYGVAIKYYSGSETATVNIKSSETDKSPYLRVKYSQQIPDGVYAIRNVEYSTWMTVENGSSSSGSFVVHKTEETSPTSSFDRSSLFKITGSDGSYIIRSMLNNNLTLDASEVMLRTKVIPSRDEDVSDEDKFSIVREGSSYLIRPYNSGNVILALPSEEYALSVLRKSEDLQNEDNWTFEQYTGNHQVGVEITNPSSWESKGIVLDTIETITLKGWSTYVDIERTVLDLRSNNEDILSLNWNESTNKATVCAIGLGKASIVIEFSTSDGSAIPDCDVVYVVIPKEGTYYIQNIDTGRYIDLEGASLANGAIIQQWAFHTEDQAKWIIEHVDGEGGYIRLKSLKSNLYIGVNSSDASVICQYPANRNTLWLIDRTANGNLKLINKLSEGTELVLSVPLNQDLNGTNLTQISYTNDVNKRDEWNIYSLSPYMVKLEVWYDQAYNNRYENAGTRISGEIRALQEKYLQEFGLLIECTGITLFNSFADVECSTDFDSDCTHADDEMCFNSDTRREEERQLLHHKNYDNILVSLPFPDTTQTLRVVYIGHNTCRVFRNENGDFLLHTHGTPYGSAYSDRGLAMINNFDGELNETKTLIHEFGHFFRAPDHYNSGDVLSTEELNAQTADGKYDSECIYGEEKEDEEIMQEFLICEGCKLKIKENIDRYDH